jgi:hypothetical protein
VATEMNDVRLMHHQQTLKIKCPNGLVPDQFEFIPAGSFLKLFKNLSRFLIHQNATRGPGISRQEKYANSFAHHVSSLFRIPRRGGPRLYCFQHAWRRNTENPFTLPKFFYGRRFGAKLASRIRHQAQDYARLRLVVRVSVE